MTGFSEVYVDLSERINAAWLVLDVCLVGYLFYYFWRGRHLAKLLSFWQVRDIPLYLQAAIAIMVFHIGDMGVRTVVWWLRHQSNRGELVWALPATAPLLFFAVIALVGILCKLRVFSGPWLGRWVWVGGGTVALLAAIGTRWLPF